MRPGGTKRYPVHTSSARPEQGRRRLNATPAKLGAFVVLAVLAVAALAGVHRRPFFAVSLPAPDPLRDVAGETRPALEIAAGPFVAGLVRPDGAFVGLCLPAAGDLELLVVWPDGRTARVAAAGVGVPTAAAVSATLVYVWVPAPPPAATGGTVYALPVERLGADSGATVRAKWQAEISRDVVRMAPTPGGLALTTADSSGIPSRWLLLDSAEGRLLREETAAGGLWTAWAAAGAAGGVALAGAQIVDGRLESLVRLDDAHGSPLFGLSLAEGPPYILSLSPTGRYLVGVTHRRLHLWTSDGDRQWSRAFPAVSVVGACVGADGRVLLASAQNILALDTAGCVTGRWRGPVLAAHSLDGVRGGLVCLLSGGGAVFAADGTPEAKFSWTGETQILACDLEGRRLWRAGQKMLQMFNFPDS